VCDGGRDCAVRKISGEIVEGFENGSKLKLYRSNGPST